MILKRLLSLFSVCCCITAVPVQAQKTWTLEDCIDYAMSHNINIQRRALQVRQREQELETSRNAWLPEVNANLAEQFSFGNYNSTTGSMNAATSSVSRNLAYTSGDVSASINLFDGFKVRSQERADRHQMDAALANLEKARKDIGIQIAVYYLQCLLDRSMAEVARSQVNVTRELQSRAATLVNEGKRPLSELKNVESQLANDEYTLTKAMGQADISLNNLVQLLNLPTSEGFLLAELPSSGEEKSTQSGMAAISAYTDIVERWPSILASKAQIEAAKSQLEVARAGYYPTLSLQANLRSFYVNMFHQNLGWGNFSNQFFDNNLNGVIGLHLSIPIFNRFRTRSAIRMAKLNITEQQLALDDARQQLRTEMQTAYTNARVARDRQAAAEKAVEAAAVSVSYEQDRYEAGRSSIFDLLTAQQKHLSARQEAVQGKYECLIRQRILEFYR